MTKQVRGANLTSSSTVQNFTLGATHETPEGNVYMYLQADGAVVANLLYSYDETTFQIEDKLEVAVIPATAKQAALCVSPIALADNAYMWVFVGPGTATMTSAAAVAVDRILYGHATVGTFSDTASACLLDGLSVQTLIGSATTGPVNAIRRMHAIDLT